MRRVGWAPLVLMACVQDGAHPSAGSSTGDGTTDSMPEPEPQGADTTEGMADPTGEPVDPACFDAHHGNQEQATALLLELGNDIDIENLVVCSGEPDFFGLDAPCAGYVGIEIRADPEQMPDIVLYGTRGQQLDEAMGTWESEFFLKPLHRRVDAGLSVVEVRHSSGSPQWYDLEVMFLPGPRCGP